MRRGERPTWAFASALASLASPSVLSSASAACCATRSVASSAADRSSASPSALPSDVLKHSRDKCARGLFEERRHAATEEAEGHSRNALSWPRGTRATRFRGLPRRGPQEGIGVGPATAWVDLAVGG